MLSSGPNSSDASSVQDQINQTLGSANSQLSRTRSLSVPDQMKTAQQTLLQAMQLRADGIQTIANEIQPALGTSTSKDAVYKIAGGTAALYASDVLYKDYVTKQMASALHGAGIAVGAPNGVAISGGQFVPDVAWVAAELHRRRVPRQAARLEHRR